MPRKGKKNFDHHHFVCVCIVWMMTIMIMVICVNLTHARKKAKQAGRQVWSRIRMRHKSNRNKTKKTMLKRIFFLYIWDERIYYILYVCVYKGHRHRCRLFYLFKWCIFFLLWFGVLLFRWWWWWWRKEKKFNAR